MPLYEYQCSQCGDRTEAIQKFSDEPLTTCESCGGRLERLLSAPAIQFKGQGWYVTDYAKKGKGDSSEKPAKAESEKSEKAGKTEKDSAKKADSGDSAKPASKASEPS